MSKLRRLIAWRAVIDGQIAAAVVEMRTAGSSWTAVGAELGCTKQAAQQRYGDASESGRG